MDLVPKEERDLLTRDKVFVIPNINEEARMFEWAGISFGEEKTFMLSKSIKVNTALPHFNCELETGSAERRFLVEILG